VEEWRLVGLGGEEVVGTGYSGVYSLRSLWKRMRRCGCVCSHLVPRETGFRLLRQTGEKIKTHGENLESAKATL
jgi:hypothetical protein